VNKNKITFVQLCGSPLIVKDFPNTQQKVKKNNLDFIFFFAVLSVAKFKAECMFS